MSIIENPLNNIKNQSNDKSILILFIIAIIIVLIIFILFTRNIIKLLGWKNFFILIAVTTILNSLSGFITTCFGTKKSNKENFPVIGIIIFVLFIGILIGSLAFQYYLIKYLGFRNFIIFVSVLSIISAISGYIRNCL